MGDTWTETMWESHRETDTETHNIKKHTHTECSPHKLRERETNTHMLRDTHTEGDIHSGRETQIL